MEDSTPGMTDLPVTCKICGADSAFHGEAEVLRKYRVRYFRCPGCGFIQTEVPYWLNEAYTSAIAVQDVGIMQRNLDNREVTSAILNLLFPGIITAADIGGGHGIFVRLMRDWGFDFRWSDRYATNYYARGFECEEGMTYEFLTAFEVLEHLTDPIIELSDLIAASDNLLVSTCLVPEPAPKMSDWWYYMPTSGQHVSFYTRQSLQHLATRFGRYFLSAGPFHLFSSNQKNGLLFSLATRIQMARLVNLMCRRPSLIRSDLDQMTR